MTKCLGRERGGERDDKGMKKPFGMKSVLVTLIVVMISWGLIDKILSNHIL